MSGHRLAIGMMTGTSIDALDAALVRFSGHGLDLRAELVRASSTPLGPLAVGLRELATGSAKDAREIARLALAFGQLHADAALELAGDELGELELICAHGQTVFHDPPASWQLLNAHPIAVRTGVPVVWDLRQADLALGGCGAPITPLADRILFADVQEPWAVVNLGGFCNITTCTDGTIAGRDLCACNQLLDELARELLNRSFDTDGASALRGWAQNDVVDDLAQRLEAQSRSGRSLGTGDELAEWARRAHDLEYSPEDILASACAAIAGVIAANIDDAETVVLAGGGVRNAALAGALDKKIRGRTISADELGIPVEHRESMAMATLGLLCADRVPITIERVTGRTDVPIVSGAWVLPELG